jgi:hypothetical protein
MALRNIAQCPACTLAAVSRYDRLQPFARHIWEMSQIKRETRRTVVSRT